MALSLSSGLMVTISGLIISLTLVSIRSKLVHQQILFFLTSTILVISPIIISLGYFIILGDLRYLDFVNYWKQRIDQLEQHYSLLYENKYYKIFVLR